jgi:hypothetical protein
MTNCNNCWQPDLKCLDCPYRIRTHVPVKPDVEKAANDLTKLFFVLNIILIILA